jgi:hypothetical protein
VIFKNQPGRLVKLHISVLHVVELGAAAAFERFSLEPRRRLGALYAVSTVSWSKAFGGLFYWTVAIFYIFSGYFFRVLWRVILGLI